VTLPAPVLEGIDPQHARNPLARAEDWLLTVLLTAMGLVPVAELVLRSTVHAGIHGAAAIVQHLGLAVGMVGSVVAARERRLLTMSALTSVFPARLRSLATLGANGIAVAVCAVLATAEAQYVLAERDAATEIAYGVPTWWVECLMPAGFAMIGWRLLARLSPNGGVRLAGLALAVALGVATVHQPPLPGWLAGVLAVALGAGALIGTPLFAVLAGAAAILFWSDGLPLAAIAVDHYRTVVNASLPAIPLFTLAGYLLAESQAPKRLIEVFDALFGRLRGGATIATVLACTFFTSFTGASGATVLALGGLVMPLLRAHGYPERPALGLVTAAGLPGTILMPALPLLLYAIVAAVPIKAMFLAGLLPSLLMATILIAFGFRHEPAHRAAGGRFDLARARRALAGAAWELTVPLVAMGSLASGLATPVESAALTVAYVLLVTTVIRGDLGFRRDLPRIVPECGLVVGGILLVMGVALGLTDYLVDAQVPDRIVAWMQAAITGRTGFLLVLNAALLAAGCLIEIYPAILVLAPLVTQLGAAYGVDPVHLGIVFLANMELGYLTPLVGLNLFFASYRFGQPISVLFRAVLPLFAALAAGVLLITYLPSLSLALPSLLR
jgi:tripartite ATP-independent transporter DctM subunit